jgi:tetratricopeptide (TPR) repeat protein
MRTFALLLGLASLPGFAMIAPAMIGGARIVPAARAADSSPTTTDVPELPSVRAQIKAKQYPAALVQLKVLAVKYPQNPDVSSLYGHALWKTGNPSQGMVYYNRALELQPSHKGALEYQGELFVELGQVDKAKENLAKLNRLCLFGCEEYNDLKAAIEHAPKKG